MNEIKWPAAPRMESGCNLWYVWHRAINEFSKDKIASDKWPGWMYQAKHAAEELARLALLFNKERTGSLPKTFRKCSCCSNQQHIVDNHLTCTLGVECRQCEFLAAINKSECSPEEKDWIKAWTCIGHILANGGDQTNEGFIQTVDDRMFWDSVYQSLASECPDITEQP